MALSSYNGGLGWLLRDKKEAARRGLSPYQYFGAVELYPDRRRSKASLKENRHYPRKIMFSFAPVVEKQWGVGKADCKTSEPVFSVK